MSYISLQPFCMFLLYSRVRESMHLLLLNAIFAVQEPDAKNAEGNTPLHYACLNGHVAIVKQLMMNGASASELNRYV